MTTNIIITGAMGSGKSTVLKLLKEEGFITIAEPAREVLAEQRACYGDGVPEKNPKLFTELMLSRSVQNYEQAQHLQEIVIYDRGIPDNIAYTELFKISSDDAHAAAKLYRYFNNVFIFPAWQEIYTTDDERKMKFPEAAAFGKAIQAIYLSYGYKLIEVPKVSPKARMMFIKANICLP